MTAATGKILLRPSRSRELTDVSSAPYGTCSAYTCEAPTDSVMESDSDCWTFFWSDAGESSGVGTGCIKDPNDGSCGCENSDGEFIDGSDSCT